MKINTKHKYSYLLDNLKKNSWCKYENALSKEITEKLKYEIKKNDKMYLNIQKKNGLGLSAQNTYHHIPLLCPSSLILLEKIPIKKFLGKYFDGKYILNIMGAVTIKSNKTKTSTQKIHRDIRSFSYNYPITLVVICLLDDSSSQNGATFFMKNGHLIKKKPNNRIFKKKSFQVCGKRGDLIIFNSNMWHSSGFNTSNSERYIATIVYSKPFIKQSLDYTKVFNNKKMKFSKYLYQILGYNSLTPKNLDQWYAVPKKRFYKTNQG